MTHIYFKPFLLLGWVYLFILFIFLAPVSRAQQRGYSGGSGVKMLPNDPLQKIGPELAALQNESAAPKTNLRTQTLTRTPTNRDLLQIHNNGVVIEALAEGNQTAQLMADLKSLGMTHSASFGRQVSGLMPIRALDKVANLKSLRFARPAYKPITKIGRVTSQGVAAMYADSVRRKQVINGKGSKIGVLSDSYDSQSGAADGIKSGDLPGAGNPNGFTTPVEVLQDPEKGAATDEGRGMMEILHDVAPGAKLAFHTIQFGEANFALGILNLFRAGCNIIVDDALYLAEPMFQDGIIAQVVDAVKQNGVSYFTAAGNQGRDSYEARFKSGGPARFGSKFIPGGLKAVDAHNFAPAGKKSDITQKVFIPVGATLIISFQYSQPFYSLGDGSSPGASSDLDIFLLTEDTTNVVGLSTMSNIGNDPVEIMSFTNTGSFESNYFNILIDKFSGPDPTIIKYVTFKNNNDITIAEYNTTGSTIYGHTNAAGATTTGAVFFLDTPAYGTPKPVQESYSSVGGTPILFDVNGNPKAPLIRQKPDIMAPDGVNTSFFGTPFLDQFYFFGTSAAAPHAAAVAALMQESGGNGIAPDSIIKTLQQTAVDMGTPGFDFETGYGYIDARKAVQAVATPRVRLFTLVDADSRKAIQTLKEGDVINLTRLPSRNVFIRARTGPERVGSVVLELNGEKITENQAPYDYPGISSDFIKLVEGEYTLTATPYRQAKGKGESGIPLTIQFKAVEENIIRFDLVNVENGEILREVAANDVLNLATLPPKLNIRAIARPEIIGSIQFNLNGKLTTENINFYEVAGSSGGRIDLKPGDYALSATTYPYKLARGTAGDSLAITFKVIDDLAVQATLLAETAGKTTNQLTVFPNPFSEKTRIRFSIPESGNAILTIYNLNGIPVAHLHSGEAVAGKQYEYILDGTTLQKGWYVSRLITDTGTLYQKLRITN